MADYNWDLETFDLRDHSLAHYYADAFIDLPTPGAHQRVVLVRDAHPDCGGSTRSWAYVVDDRLPMDFEDGVGCRVAAVPKRFHEELAVVRMHAWAIERARERG